MYKVKEVSLIAGVSVRTLHHYDHINLLNPQSVTAAGYRLYNDDDLEILQHILFLRELEFTLKEIKEIIWSPGYDKEKALVEHRLILLEKRKRLNRIIDTLDKTIASRKEGQKMENKEMFDAFDMKEIEEHQKQYADEVRVKYGHTSAYGESRNKTGSYTKEDWIRIKSESDSILKKLAENLDKKSDDVIVQELVCLWQKHITESFYNCTNVILAGLGESYVDDERFKKNIDKYADGLAVFLRDAIRYYCR